MKNSSQLKNEHKYPNNDYRLQIVDISLLKIQTPLSEYGFRITVNLYKRCPTFVAGHVAYSTLNISLLVLPLNTSSTLQNIRYNDSLSIKH